MGWSKRAGRGTGDEPGPGFGPPRSNRYQDEERQADGAPRDANGAKRDERLAGFAADGEHDNVPSAELADILESVSGAGWRCPGATDDEMVGVVRRWAAIESWAGAAKLGVIRELIRREDTPWLPADRQVDTPAAWSESLTHEIALALAASVGSADGTAWLAWELGTRLTGIDALLTDGTLSYGKAKAVAEAFQHLSDADAAYAESLILGQVAGKTYRQVVRLATMAASKADPEGDERRRKDAEKHAARVRLWREQSGAAALAGFDLPTDEALAAHANVSARAEQYEASGAFLDAKMDQLRAMGYLDLLNSVAAETRIADALARQGPPGSADPEATDDAPDDDDGLNDDGPDDEGPDDDGPDDDGPDDEGPDNEGPDAGQPAGPNAEPNSTPEQVRRPGTDLAIPLATLLGFGNRPGEGHQLGPLDPGLCRDLAVSAANSPATEFCITVTDLDGIAIGHGCARPVRRARQPASGSSQTARSSKGAGITALPARVNLTVTSADLHGSVSPASREGPASRGSPWAFTPRADGTWTFSVPGGGEFTVRLERVPTFDCDHARESHAYQANRTLRHLVQVRDGDCTFPSCARHARETDFEHAVPYDKGGRTCACNAGARSRRCHRIKQSPGWNVTQPKPGFHQWTTPTGRVYTQEPKRYPV